MGNQVVPLSFLPLPVASALSVEAYICALVVHPKTPRLSAERQALADSWTVIDELVGLGG